jgi:sugar fermentation stimulation protein A
MNLITISDLKKGLFMARPNRYLADVEMEGAQVKVHVHDPGRLKELLYEGNECLVRYAAGLKRKTEWDMIAASVDDGYVLIHSGYHRYIANAILENHEISPFGMLKEIRAEVKFGHSRMDFRLLDEKGEAIWVEVKGCSLSENGIAKFPDAPTVRGTKHLESLIAIKESGERACVFILVLGKSEVFEPNGTTDPVFYDTFYKAMDNGVEIYPLRVELDPESGVISFIKIIPIKERIR